jgi:hypothetical protein
MNLPGHQRSLAAALAIARRDLLEFVRDRRTLVITLLLPMATYPILALSTALGLRTASQELEARAAPSSMHVGLSGPDAERLASLMKRTLADTPPSGRSGWPANLEIADVRAADVESLLDQGAITLWIETHAGLVRELESTGTVRLKARVSATRPAGPAVREQFEAFIRTLGRDVARERVQSAGLPATLLEPVRIAFEGDRGPAPTASHNVFSTLAGGVLVLLTVLTLTGAFYPAIDAIAGEKERGTIETLLIAPCRIDDIVWGKFFGVFAITLAEVSPPGDGGDIARRVGRSGDRRDRARLRRDGGPRRGHLPGCHHGLEEWQGGPKHAHSRNPARERGRRHGAASRDARGAASRGGAIRGPDRRGPRRAWHRHDSPRVGLDHHGVSLDVARFLSGRDLAVAQADGRHAGRRRRAVSRA